MPKQSKFDGISHQRPSSSRPYMPTPEQFLDSTRVDEVDSGDGNLEPLRRPHRKRRRIGRVIKWSLLALALIFVVYVGYLASSVAKISTQPVTFSGLSADSTGRVNVLVLGVGDPGHAGQNLSDTVMVMSLDTATRRIAQISIPRDLRVNIPGYGAHKINEANSDGGPGLAEQTVSNTLGIPINYYVKTDFTGLSQIVDAVGGIDVNVKEELRDTEYPCADNQYKVCGLDIKPGEQHMDGATALEYVRCRKGTCGNDFGRAARQQEVLELVRKKVLTWQVLLNPVKLNKIVAAVRDHVETDMGAVQMAEFARDWQAGQKNAPVQLVFSTSPGGLLTSAGSSSDLLPIGGDFGPMQRKVQTIFNN